MSTSKDLNAVIREALNPATTLSRLYEFLESDSILVRANAIRSLMHRAAEDEHQLIGKLTDAFEKKSGHTLVIGSMTERMFIVYALFVRGTPRAIERAQRLSHSLTSEELSDVKWHVENNP